MYEYQLIISSLYNINKYYLCFLLRFCHIINNIIPTSIIIVDILIEGVLDQKILHIG